MGNHKPITFRLVPHSTTATEKDQALTVKREIITFLLRKVMDEEKPSP
ncbi:hypothetical protein [Bacillus sp. NEB1478]|nr:hypothetical protein [Bacillus sp. NEB1478]WNB93434.1 hypothetical protein RGB74_07120 [Bacillus sp. NEB1478]